MKVVSIVPRAATARIKERFGASGMRRRLPL